MTPLALLLFFGVLLFDGNARVTSPIPMACVLLVIVLQAVQHVAVRRRDGRLYRALEDHAVNLERSREALEHQTLYDPLTDLPNRALLSQRLEPLFARAGVAQAQHALLVLGFDRFRDINNAFGHAFGDSMLQQIAHRFTATLPAGATTARIGGDEFAVLLPQTDLTQAWAVADLLQTSLRAPFTLSQQTLQCTASVGIALFPDDGTDTATLLRHAGVALHSAKRQRRRITRYDPAEDNNSPDRLALLADLRQVLDQNGLDVYYQPQADASDEQVASVEALVRWNHPTRGFIAPDQFIPLAESTGLIGLLTQRVLDTAISQCHAWLEAGRRLAVAVNLSAWNLHDDTLPDMIAQLLALYQVPATLLRLELTESAVMNDPARATEVLNRLAALGIEVSIDDYGTGYSSLAYLKRLPVTELKIDRSFVMDMGTDPTDAIIVASTIGLGHSLGLRVVAEGVEDRDTWNVLAALGCDLVQGYVLSRAVPSAALLDWLNKS